MRLVRKLRKLNYPVWFGATLLLGIGIGSKLFQAYHQWNAQNQVERADFEQLVLLLIIVTFLLISILNHRLFETIALRTLADIEKTSKDSGEDIKNVIIEKLSPSIIALDTNDEVLKQASDIINAAIEEPSRNARYLVYIGSGDLQKDPPPHDPDKPSPATEYQSSIARVRKEQIRIDRYISLLRPDELTKRDPKTQEAYKKWVSKQIENLEGNSNYSILDCTRAPQWGSSRSSIFTERALIDVVGNGLSGVLIRGDKISNALQAGSVSLFYAAYMKPVAYDTPAKLRAYLETLNPVERVAKDHLALAP